VGWETSTPTEMSHTHASPPAWLAMALNKRNRTGSANALSLAARVADSSGDSGSRINGGDAQHAPSAMGDWVDFDMHRY
ncbi:MAG: hypothetical protein QOK33_4566, partial [Mycobacterium sp.]|nr:hypothetical protein [Mycobacterium sp.]